MICPNCKRPSSEGEEYCDDCGAQLVAETPSLSSEPESSGHLKAGDELNGRYRISASFPLLKGFRYEARDSQGDKEVVVYEKPLAGAGQSNVLKLQWDVLKELNEPRFPVVLEYFENGEKAFLVSEVIPGESLEDVLKRDKAAFPPLKVMEWGISLCEAVGKLHAKNLLHRGLQPSNIIRQENDSLILSGFERLCPLGEVPDECAVTPGFSAPEAYGIGDGKVDVRSDVYSIGASLYCLISGKTPHLEQRETFFAFPPFNEYKVKVSPDVENVILTAVNKKLDERFQSVTALMDALKKVYDEEATRAKLPEAVSLSFKSGMITNIGCVRSINQDSCLYMIFQAYEKSEPKDCALFVVADGMGGEAEGEKASSLAIRAIAHFMVESRIPVEAGQGTRMLLPEEVMERNKILASEALKQANSIVFEYSQKESYRKGMGSTISAALIEGDTLVVGHAGDTRVYLIRDTIEQISEDHSLVGRLVKMGQMKKEEALRSPQRSMVYRALGTSPQLDVDVYERKLQSGDTLLICSDGVWEYYLDDELLNLVQEYKEPQKICNRLVELCLERGADDNCTAIVVTMTDST
ncbi:MAG: SpoIIE family protein phosphatase [Candidatus Eremiobacteraeota bacterium]|nr:SpoIIE family protein phosphatase [Candidatus Eremiobacteraeota bacterium]